MPTKGNAMTKQTLAAVAARATKSEVLAKLLTGPVSRVNREAAVAVLQARALRGEAR